MIPPGGNAAFVAAMEEVLAVYARPVDPRRPLVCFDEAGKDLKAPTRLAQPVAPGRAARETASTRATVAAICFWPVPPTSAGARSS